LNRRKAIVTLGFTALSGVAWSITRSWVPQAGDATSNQAIDDRLRDDLAQRNKRINSEEGIVMFLVCENLVAGSPEPQVTAMNSAVAAAFQQTADAWQRIHPDAKYGDVAQVIEVIAARDFARGGMEAAQ
jgi:hypothetical protein